MTPLLRISLVLALWLGQGTPADSAFETRVREVAASLRCPVCQNLSIQDSPSELALDMKRLVREQLAAGKTPDEVRQYFVTRYGEWVLLEPRARGVNLTVWLLPVLAIAGGALLMWVAVRRWVRPAPAVAGGPGGPGGAAAPPPPLPPIGDADELRARRARLVTTLEELAADFADHKITAADYETLKQRDEAELRAVKAALKERHDKPSPPSPQIPTPRSLHPAFAWGLGFLVFGAVVAFALTKAVRPRAAGGTITGVDLSGSATQDDGGQPGDIAPVDTARLHRLEARVARDSNDYSALVELGHVYLTQQRLARSAQVSMRAVRLRPDAQETAEAFAHMGMILWNAGETDAGLRSLEKALELHADFPEALLYKGIILFAAKRDMAGATAAWERYLQVAPPDANTARVRAMLQAARSAR